MALIDAILLGAGTGTRYSRNGKNQEQLPKQFQVLEEKPVFIWALQSLLAQVPLRRVIVVVAPGFLDLTKKLLNQHFPKRNHFQIEFVLGGNRRQDSSLNAVDFMKNLRPWPELVLIHDACRPFIGNTLANGLQMVSDRPNVSGWIPGIPVTDTIKEVFQSSVAKTLNRSDLVRVQTPQLFKFEVLVKILEQIRLHSNLDFTDDASMLEHFGEPVAVFRGDERNVKLTYEIDSQSISHFLKTIPRKASCASEPATTFTA